VLQCVEQGELLRQLAREYGVSYEAVLCVMLAAVCAINRPLLMSRFMC
jgi:hypothetical protein